MVISFNAGTIDCHAKDRCLPAQQSTTYAAETHNCLSASYRSVFMQARNGSSLQFIKLLVIVSCIWWPS